VVNTVLSVAGTGVVGHGCLYSSSLPIILSATDYFRFSLTWFLCCYFFNFLLCLIFLLMNWLADQLIN
jgi:hypothetical protein